jgi:hypothetical protein
MKYVFEGLLPTVRCPISSRIPSFIGKSRERHWLPKPASLSAGASSIDVAPRRAHAAPDGIARARTRLRGSCAPRGLLGGGVRCARARTDVCAHICRSVPSARVCGQRVGPRIRRMPDAWQETAVAVHLTLAAKAARGPGHKSARLSARRQVAGNPSRRVGDVRHVSTPLADVDRAVRKLIEEADAAGGSRVDRHAIRVCCARLVVVRGRDLAAATGFWRGTAERAHALQRLRVAGLWGTDERTIWEKPGRPKVGRTLPSGRHAEFDALGIRAGVVVTIEGHHRRVRGPLIHRGARACTAQRKKAGGGESSGETASHEVQRRRMRARRTDVFLHENPRPNCAAPCRPLIGASALREAA